MNHLPTISALLSQRPLAEITAVRGLERFNPLRQENDALREENDKLHQSLQLQHYHNTQVATQLEASLNETTQLSLLARTTPFLVDQLEANRAELTCLSAAHQQMRENLTAQVDKLSREKDSLQQQLQAVASTSGRQHLVHHPNNVPVNYNNESVVGFNEVFDNKEIGSVHVDSFDVSAQTYTLQSIDKAMMELRDSVRTFIVEEDSSNKSSVQSTLDKTSDIITSFANSLQEIPSSPINKKHLSFYLEEVKSYRDQLDMYQREIAGQILQTPVINLTHQPFPRLFQHQLKEHVADDTLDRRLEVHLICPARVTITNKQKIEVRVNDELAQHRLFAATSFEFKMPDKYPFRIPLKLETSNGSKMVCVKLYIQTSLTIIVFSAIGPIMMEEESNVFKKRRLDSVQSISIVPVRGTPTDVSLKTEMSRPFLIVTHQKQVHTGWCSLFKCCLGSTDQSLDWLEFKEKFQGFFNTCLNLKYARSRFIGEEEINYFHRRFFKEQAVVDQEQITLFVQYFTKCLSTLYYQPVLANLWNEYLFAGFIDKDFAMSFLCAQPPGTFLLRFSENNPGRVVLLYHSRLTGACERQFIRDHETGESYGYPALILEHSQLSDFLMIDRDAKKYCCKGKDILRLHASTQYTFSED